MDVSQDTEQVTEKQAKNEPAACGRKIEICVCQQKIKYII